MRFILIMLLSLASFFSNTIFAANGVIPGTGTESDPWLIEDLDDFQAFCNSSAMMSADTYTSLTVDIDLGLETYTSSPIDTYYGNFDGNGHTISNLSISGDSSYIGLFGQLDGSISGLGLSSCAITGNGSYRGSLVGYNNYGNIYRCYAVSVQVNGNNHTGGLVGYNYHGSVSECYASDVLIGGNSYIGGLCGYNNRATIVNSYASGIVSGSSHIGGTCGRNEYGSLLTSYSSCVVSGGDSVGGFLGSSYNSTLTDCYFYKYGGRDNNLGTELDSVEMMTQSNYTGLNFSEVWSITSGYYPSLQYQTTPAPTPNTLALSTTLSGSGTVNDPFIISDYDDFMEFSTNAALRFGYYELTSDIDLLNMSITSAVIPERFIGSFNGNGHVISNFTISGDSGYIGLFAKLDGSITGLGVSSCAITGNGTYRGSLVGYNNYGSIYQCFADNVQVNGNNHTGGLTGYNYYGSVSECYASDVLVGGNSYIGGLNGYNNRGTIVNCYASGIVSGSSHIGGTCGRAEYGSLLTSYASCVVSGGDSVGGFLGSSYNSTVTDCYFYKYGGRDNNLGTELDSVEMLAQSNYTGLNFSEVWSITSGYYPNLQYQTTPAPTSHTLALSTTLSGTGTVDDPFIISDYDDFMEFATNAALRYGYYELTSDIDLLDMSITSAVIPERFIGTLNGNGHVISNFTISGDSSYVGLFSQLDGSITGLGVSSCTITGNGSYRGSLVGKISYGSIHQCFAEYVQLNGNDFNGGLVGYNYHGSISECYASDILVGGTNHIGGLNGYNNRGTIVNCYTSGAVSGSTHIGGTCGRAEYGSLLTSYSSCFISGGDSVGGFLGSSYNSTVTDCYFYKYGGRDNNLGTDLDSVEMLAQSNYTGLNFSEVWSITSGYYPNLQYQTTPAPTPNTLALITTLSGSGTVDDPFIISDYDDFMEFATNAALRYGYYELTSDIDLLDMSITSAVIPESFIGTLNGNGHVISNFTISGDSSYIGLFAQLDGSITNLGVSSCTIIGNGSYRGSLVGKISYGSIYQCFAEYVQVNGNNYIGGLVGYNYYGSVSECYASDAQVSGSGYTGGFCGYNNRGTLANSYSSGSVNSSGTAGGFCGRSEYGSLITSYSTSIVINGSGFLGNSYNASITNCFWDTDTSGQTTSAGGTGKTTEEMFTQTTFLDANWNYITDEAFGVWYSFENDYPRLTWEVVTVPSVEGLVYNDAVTLIADSGIRLGSISYAYSFSVPAEYIIEQDIAAGELLSHRGMINLVVSKGPELTTVPDVSGLSEADATDAIIAAKLEIGDITFAYDFDMPAGYVLSQSIEADLRVIINNTVDLVVSAGPEYTTVPDVSGLTEAEAVLAILQAKLAVADPIVHRYDFDVPSGYIISQGLNAGESVIITSEVSLVVSDGPEMVGVPSLYDMNLTEAIGIIEAADLEVGSISYDYSFTVAHGNVIGQSIAGGGTTVIGSAVNLVVSDGPQIVTMPDFTGISQTEAEAAILDAGFVIGTHIEHYSATIDAGYVMDQDQIAGDFALVGSTVRLLISKGNKMTSVPAVTGLSQELAEALILAADLSIGTVTSEHSMTVAAGGVINQSLIAGNSVAVETTVDIVVSSGPEMTIVPSLAGLTETQAISALSGVTLAIGDKTYEYSLTVTNGSVISQSVPAGESLIINSSVDLVISKGSMVVVPNVIEMEQSQAETAIISADLTIGSISTDYSSTVPVGYVISQSTNPGEEIQFNTAIDLVISVGPEMVIVPNLSNMTQAEAEAALAQARLTLGTVSYGMSYTVNIDKVISQGTQKGSSVVVGSGVDIVISQSTTEVNMLTFANLAANWLVTVNDPATGWDIVDFNADSTIDQYDLILLAENWLSSEKIAVEQVEADYFETGDLTALNWQNDDPNQWNIVEEPYRGAYAAKSGEVDDMCASTMSLTLDTTGYSTISFAGKISSEQDYDYLLFFIDGKLTDYFSGEIDWTIYSYNIKTEGTHTFTWSYEKDQTISEGQDCVWIDDVIIK